MSVRYIVLEFYGKGDPMFGGGADDRVLGKNGAFLTGVHSRSDYKTFPSKESALAHGEAASNRRPGGKLLAVPK